MKTNLLVSINKLEDIKEYEKVGCTTFLFALKDFSIGYKDFSIDEINSYGKGYVLINRVLDCMDIDELKHIISEIKCIGFVIEDIGVINIIKELTKDKKIILFMNHFNCNYKSINEWFNFVDSVIVSNELTYEEIKDITSMSNKKVILQVFGYNQVMYSRRLLLKNYYDKFNLEYKNFSRITDKQNKISFLLWESEYGTVVYSDKVFDGRRLYNLDNVLYYYINASMLNTSTVIDFINGREVANTDSGFLEKKTVYKMGDY